jgi:hypothetical protein
MKLYDIFSTLHLYYNQRKVYVFSPLTRVKVSLLTSKILTLNYQTTVLTKKKKEKKKKIVQSNKKNVVN